MKNDAIIRSQGHIFHLSFNKHLQLEGSSMQLFGQENGYKRQRKIQV